MKTILLPTDFSKNSQSAIDYTLELFKDVVCTFHLLNVQKASSFISDDLKSLSTSTTVYESLIASAKTNLNELIIKLESRKNKNHSFEAMVDYDNFIDAINQACVMKNIDLIAMGTQGATGAERILFGSNTVRVMQRAIRPVLAIPGGSKFSSLDRVAFTSNYRSEYKKDDLMPLLHLVEIHDSKIDILHVLQEDKLSESQKNNKEFLDKYFRYVNHEFIHLEKGEIFECVNNFIKENDIKLLGLMSRKHSFVERLFNVHAVETFGFKLSIPMLVMENTGELMD